jgi:tetratricopeptide (TPR) repeat protein
MTRRPSRRQSTSAASSITWLAIGLITAIGIWAYSSSFSGVFMADDVRAIVENQQIRTLLPLPLAAPDNTTLAGRPVANLSFALNYALAPIKARDVMRPGDDTATRQLFYKNVFGYHAANLAIHIFAGLALFGVVRRSLLTPKLRDGYASRSTLIAAAVALIWLVHPLQTGAVTFVVQRVESLMGLFFLFTLYCAIRATETDFRDTRWTMLAIVACALGMGTKESMVGAPILVALWVWIFRPDIWLARNSRPLWIGVGATWAILIWIISSQPRSDSVGFGLGGWSAAMYFRTQAEVVVHYLRLAFWPEPLVFQYAWLPVRSWIEALPELLILGLLATGSLLALARRSPAGLLGCWFFLFLAPSSSFLPVVTEVAAEHRMYLPLAAVIAAIVFGVDHMLRLPSARISTMLTRASAVAAAAAIVTLSVATHDRNLVYASEEGMIADIVRSRPQNAQAQLMYAAGLLGKEQYAEAAAHLRLALTLPLPPGTDEKPTALMHMYLGSALCAQGKLEEGSRELAFALAINPHLGEAYGFLGEANLSQGRAADAIANFRRAIQELPNVPPILTRAAWVLATSRDARARNGEEAVMYAEKAVSLTGRRDVRALEALAAAHAELRRFEVAGSIAGEALSLAMRSGDGRTAQEIRSELSQYQMRLPVRTADW